MQAARPSVYRLLPPNDGMLPPNDSMLPPNDGLLRPNNGMYYADDRKNRPPLAEVRPRRRRAKGAESQAGHRIMAYETRKKQKEYCTFATLMYASHIQH